MSECLHCDIGQLIAERVSNGPKPVDLAEIGSMIAQALGEFILAAPEHEQADLMAECLATLSHTFLDKPDEESERPHRPH
jgi:hypothetical protein